MKRFNVDEFIWFLIQLILISLMLYLVDTGNVTYFINDNMIAYFYLAIVILVLFSVAQLSKVFTIKSRNEITNKFVPITIVLVLGITLIFILPAYKALKSNKIDDRLLYSVNNMITINNDNYLILKEIDKLKEQYLGNFVEIVGKVSDEISYNEEIVLVREQVNCCQSDKETIKIRTRGINNKVDSNTWIKVIGVINYDKGWYLEVKDYKITREPEDVYFHKEL